MTLDEELARAVERIAELEAAQPNLESRDFYEVMQAYRHEPLDAHVQFEAVKAWLRNPTYEWDATSQTPTDSADTEPAGSSPVSPTKGESK